jgi:hypothetical protein
MTSITHITEAKPSKPKASKAFRENSEFFIQGIVDRMQNSDNRLFTPLATDIPPSLCRIGDCNTVTQVVFSTTNNQ